VKQARSIVSLKVKFTALIAGISSIITIFGGLLNEKIIVVIGVMLLLLSPYISLAIVLKLTGKNKT
jgi:hypothetical protein